MMDYRYIVVALLLLIGCASKPVVYMPAESPVDMAIHCGPANKDNDGCIVEEGGKVMVYVLTRKAMCDPNRGD